MEALGCKVHPLVFYKREAQTLTVVHADGFLWVGRREELEALLASPKMVYDLKSMMFRNVPQWNNYYKG